MVEPTSFIGEEGLVAGLRVVGRVLRCRDDSGGGIRVISTVMLVDVDLKLRLPLKDNVRYKHLLCSEIKICIIQEVF